MFVSYFTYTPHPYTHTHTHYTVLFFLRELPRALKVQGRLAFRTHLHLTDILSAHHFPWDSKNNGTLFLVTCWRLPTLPCWLCLPGSPWNLSSLLFSLAVPQCAIPPTSFLRLDDSGILAPPLSIFSILYDLWHSSHFTTVSCSRVYPPLRMHSKQALDVSCDITKRLTQRKGSLFFCWIKEWVDLLYPHGCLYSSVK